MDTEDYGQVKTKFKQALRLLAAGIVARLESRRATAKGDPYAYPIDGRFRHGLDLLADLYVHALPGGELGELGSWSESWAERVLLARPVSNWLPQAKGPYAEAMASDGLWQCGPFLIHENGVTVATDTCEELADFAGGRDIAGEVEENEAYAALISLSPEAYVELRRTVIEHAELSPADFSQVCLIAALAGHDKPTDVKAALGYVYVQSPDGSHRLTHGADLYIRQPGQLELQIAAHAQELELAAELWPHKDRYDIKVSFCDGEIWAIDAKTNRDPRVLASALEDERPFEEGGTARQLYVVPEQRVANRADYLKICRYALRNTGYECITDRELYKRMRRKQREVVK